MKILFLTRYPHEGASSRYRVHQYIPHLEALGVTCHVQSFMDETMYRLSFSSGRTPAKIAAALKACLKRLHAIRRHRDYDVIYMQRELFPFGPPLVERVLKARGARLIFDYDDALFINKPSRYNLLASLLRSSEKSFDLFRLSDCVIAGNDWLRDIAAQHGGKAVTIEVAEDTTRIRMRPRHDNENGVLIGWLGSNSTVKYLRLIEPVLRRIAERYPFVRFEIVGGGAFDLDRLPVTHTEWSMDNELTALARFDIGLMPLPLEDWSRGKSGGKARTYMAAGVPPVCTAIGYNLELIRNGETGFLCTTGPEWDAALSHLIEHPAVRQNIADTARREVAERFAPQKKAGEILAVLRKVAGHEEAIFPSSATSRSAAGCAE